MHSPPDRVLSFFRFTEFIFLLLDRLAFAHVLLQTLFIDSHCPTHLALQHVPHHSTTVFWSYELFPTPQQLGLVKSEVDPGSYAWNCSVYTLFFLSNCVRFP